MVIREYEPKDCKELAGLFYNTVHTVDAKDYTKEQLDAWATGKIDLEKWNQSFQEHYSIVAVDGEITIGFGDIDKTGYLDRLYVHKDYQGKGVATICTNLLVYKTELCHNKSQGVIYYEYKYRRINKTFARRIPAGML